MVVLSTDMNTDSHVLREAKDLLEDIKALLGLVSAGGESSIAAGGNFRDVTHGLGGTPSIIFISPEDGFDAPFEIPRAHIGAATFRVAYKGGILQDAGTTGYFLWGGRV